MEIRVLDDRDRWNKLVLSTSSGNLLQSYEWGEFKASFGWKPVRIAIYDTGHPVAGVQLLIRHLPVGTVAYAPRGPLVDFADTSTAEALLAEMHRVAQSHGAIFLKIEPEVRSSSDLESFLRRHGFAAGGPVQPRSTMVVDLSPNIDIVASRLNRQTRYNIGLAGRKGTIARIGSAEDIEHFYRLLVETSQRSHFPIHDRVYYERAWRTLEKSGMARLFLATNGGKTLAAAMVIAFGQRAHYLYGASSQENRHLKPNDFLQWECLKWAKSQGCQSYDQWGIPDPIGEATEQGLNPEVVLDKASDGQPRTMWGVYQFKRGFGGEVVRYAGAYDYVYSRARHWLYLQGVSRLKGVAKARPVLASPAFSYVSQLAAIARSLLPSSNPFTQSLPHPLSSRQAVSSPKRQS